MAEPGRLVGRGRAADVYDVGGGRVLRRYRTEHDSTREADLMRHVAEHGFPVPAVHDVDGRDLVMDRVEGRTQLEDIEKRPWRVASHGRVLADLHRRLDAIPSPAGDGGIVHLDLHPGNVLCSPSGPVVIDWSNGTTGDRHADVATTWMLLAAGRPDGGAAIQVLAALLRRWLVRAFLAGVDVAAARQALTSVCDAKLRDPNMSASERDAIRALAASEAT